MNLRKFHLVIGFAVLILFPLTGAYMRFYLADEFAASDRLRFSVRANHVYILLSALIHLALGTYLQRKAVSWRAKLQQLGSTLLSISTILVVTAFVYESKVELDRPVSLAGMVSGAFGVLLHLAGTLGEDR